VPQGTNNPAVLAESSGSEAEQSTAGAAFGSDANILASVERETGIIARLKIKISLIYDVASVERETGIIA
jgi:hypothetical protein